MSDNTALSGASNTSGDSIVTHDTGRTDGSGRSIKYATSTIRHVDPNVADTNGTGLIFDQVENLVAGGGFGGPTVYANATTDLEGFRDDFHGTSLQFAVTGTSVTLTNGGSTITGVGTSFTSQFNTADVYVKLSSDPDSALTKLLYQPYYRPGLVSGGTSGNTTAYLAAAYSGTGGTGAGTFTYWLDSVGSGGSISVGSGAAASSEIAISAGTTGGSATYIQHGSHYVAPCYIDCVCRVSALSVGTECGFGIVDVPGGANVQMAVVFQGVNPNQVTVRTSQIGTDVESNTFSLPAGMSVLQYHRYRIICGTNVVQLRVDNVVVGENRVHLPPLYSPQPLSIWAYNPSAPAVATNFVVDTIGIVSHDEVMVEMATTSNPAPAHVTGYDQAGLVHQAMVLPGGGLGVSILDASGNVCALVPTGSGQYAVPTFDFGNSQTFTSLLDKITYLTQLVEGTINVRVANAMVPRSLSPPVTQSFPASTTATLYLQYNPSRLGAIFMNDFTSASTLYLLVGAGTGNVTSSTNYTVALKPGAEWEIPSWGIVHSIGAAWSGSSGTVYLTEFSNASV